MMARALRAFRDGDGTDWDWAGALLIAEHIDDTRFVRNFAEQYGKALSKRRRR